MGEPSDEFFEEYLLVCRDCRARLSLKEAYEHGGFDSGCVPFPDFNVEKVG